ncbi:DUF500-domain-containing protein [Aureobasidium subglaciale]|nr:DUF500-domain-containing protein [Aureobasidium subglaciale]
MTGQQSTWWSRVSGGGKVGFDKAWNLVDKLGAPVNKLSNKLGSEAFWPTTLDRESDKAARILRSFCKDGFYQEETTKPTADGPKAKQRVLKHIPPEVIKNAKGLAIFTTMRTGLWVSGAGGSGVLVGRTADGSWSPPSGIMLHTAGLGFLVGVDIYDCVVVINSQKALDAFSKIRCTLGGEVSAVAGPVGAGGLLETEIHKRQAPIFTYLKSRGFYAGVQIDGTVVIERTDENERFYNEKISVGDILAGKIRHPPLECRPLLETIKAAQGDKDVDQSALPSAPPPSDLDINNPDHFFGIPDREDPDPYGVLALEKEGMSIREAGTQKRASWEQFNFQPAPTSPIFNTFSRQSLEKNGSRNRSSSNSTWKTSNLSQTAISSASTALEQPKRASVTRSMSDMCTQTDFAEPISPRVGSFRSRQSSLHEIAEDSNIISEPRPKIDRNPSSRSTRSSPRRSSFRSSHRRTDSGSDSRSDSPPQQSTPAKPEHKDIAEESFDDVDVDGDGDGDDTADEAIIEEPVVHSVQKATAPQFISRARLVEVPKRITPKLPPRNPNRGRGPVVINAEPGVQRTSPELSSPEESPLKTNKPDWSAPSSPDKLGAESSGYADPSPSPGEERNPWGHILEQHRRNESKDSLDMPGTFHSLPPTPDETREGAPIS